MFAFGVVTVTDTALLYWPARVRTRPPGIFPSRQRRGFPLCTGAAPVYPLDLPSTFPTGIVVNCISLTSRDAAREMKEEDERGGFFSSREKIISYLSIPFSFSCPKFNIYPILPLPPLDRSIF